VPEITTDNVELVFGSVPLDEGQQATVKLVTERFTEMARTVLTNVPRCAHRTVVLRRLLEAKMLCVDAIAKGGLI
jgi:hypothetical protein